MSFTFSSAPGGWGSSLLLTPPESVKGVGHAIPIPSKRLLGSVWALALSPRAFTVNTDIRRVARPSSPGPHLPACHPQAASKDSEGLLPSVEVAHRCLRHPCSGVPATRGPCESPPWKPPGGRGRPAGGAVSHRPPRPRMPRHLLQDIHLPRPASEAPSAKAPAGLCAEPPLPAPTR